MKYMGSKQRIAKHILPIILADRMPNQTYVEPFCGGCNSLDKVQNPRVANDSNKYLIALFKEMQSKSPFNPPEIDEGQYKHIRENKKEYEDWLVGYVGFNLSFAAKFFGGYARDKAGLRDYASEARRNLVAQQKNIEGIEFTCGDYTEIFIPDYSIIYCDPPYRNTTKYSTKDFDHESFYDWCRLKVNEGHTIFVSEYNMPLDFECVWSKELTSSLTQDTGSKKAIEKLFKLTK